MERGHRRCEQEIGHAVAGPGVAALHGGEADLRNGEAFAEIISLQNCHRLLGSAQRGRELRAILGIARANSSGGNHLSHQPVDPRLTVIDHRFGDLPDARDFLFRNIRRPTRLREWHCHRGIGAIGVKQHVESLEPQCEMGRVKLGRPGQHLVRFIQPPGIPKSPGFDEQRPRRRYLIVMRTTELGQRFLRASGGMEQHREQVFRRPVGGSRGDHPAHRSIHFEPIAEHRPGIGHGREPIAIIRFQAERTSAGDPRTLFQYPALAARPEMRHGRVDHAERTPGVGEVGLVRDQLAKDPFGLILAFAGILIEGEQSLIEQGPRLGRDGRLAGDQRQRPDTDYPRPTASPIMSLRRSIGSPLRVTCWV